MSYLVARIYAYVSVVMNFQVNWRMDPIKSNAVLTRKAT